MSDAVNEQLSAFLDGELNSDEQWRVLSRMQGDSTVRTRFERYQLVSDALRNNLPAASLPGLAQRVSQALEREPVVLAPRRRAWRMRPFAKQAAGMAVAATIATVAVLSLHTGSPDGALNGNQLASTTPAAVATGPASVGPASVGALASPMRLVSDSSEDAQARLNRYLVNHNEYSAASSMPGMMPYMRIVSYPAPNRVVNENR